MINFVLFHATWTTDSTVIELVDESEEITIEEYTENMRGHIFCPRCKKPTFKTPQDKVFDAKGRRFFSHNRSEDADCEWRIKTVTPFYFTQEHQVEQAIADENLVVIHSFMNNPPENLPNGNQNFYNEVPADVDGDQVNRQLSRHTNGMRAWPTKITTIRSIVRRFDQNLDRYYSLPRNPTPVQLRDTLHYVGDIPEIYDENLETIYFGRIRSIVKHGTAQPHNVAFIYFVHARGKNGHADISVKTTVQLLDQYGITDDHLNSYVLVHGSLQTNGTGISIRNPTYGEIAVLPAAYNNSIEAI